MADQRRQVVRLATPEDLVTIALEHQLPTPWPPPDTHVEYTGPIASNVLYTGGALLFDVVSDSGDLPAAGFWWTTLGNLVLGSLADSAAVQEAISLLVAQVSGPWTGVASAYPVVIERNEGLVMKWVRNTYRGILGDGVEQFQFKIDLGHPGQDPDYSAATCAALAETLAGTFKGTAAAAMYGGCSDEVTFTEVGCVMYEATSATAKDGSGGNAAQKFPTEWYAWPTATRPKGPLAQASLPYEVACAVSLQTDIRGPSGKGRFYLPPFAVGMMESLGRWGNVPAWLAGAQAWIEAVNAASGLSVVVVSPRRLILNDVTSVGIGIIPDSQRRRRRSQNEARTSLLISA